MLCRLHERGSSVCLIYTLTDWQLGLKQLDNVLENTRLAHTEVFYCNIGPDLLHLLHLVNIQAHNNGTRWKLLQIHEEKKYVLTLSRKQSLSLVLASSISTSKKTTAFLAFLAGLRLAGAWAGTVGAAATAAPLAGFLVLAASSAKASMSTVLLLHSVYSLLPLNSSSWLSCHSSPLNGLSEIHAKP